MSRRVGSPNADVIAVTADAKSVGESGAPSGESARGAGALGEPLGTAGILPTAVVEILRRTPSPRPEAPPVPTEAEIIEALRPVEDPELHRSIVDLGMVKQVSIDGGEVTVLIALTTPGCPLRNEIQKRVTDGVTTVAGVASVSLDFTAMTEQELAGLRQQLNGNPAATAGSQAAHGHAEGRVIPF